ncbi:hypothetical protein ACI3KY_19390, partial [Microbacterium sp. ZW T2_14]
ELEPRPGADRVERLAGRGIRRAGEAVLGGVTRTTAAVRGVVRRRRREIEAPTTSEDLVAASDEASPAGLG